MSLVPEVEADLEPQRPASGMTRRFPFLAALVLSILIVGCAWYGKLRTNLNGENFRIACALFAGDGFANPTGDRTGPTAWSAPAYPAIFVTLLWLDHGNHEFVIGAVAFLQVCVLIATGILVLALIRQTTERISAWLAAAIFLGALCYHFGYWFGLATDCWLMLLTFDLLIAGFCWLAPMRSRWRAAGWGVFGGLIAMVNPSIALAWGVLSLVVGVRSGGWSRAGVALLVAVLTLTPWTVRNLWVFGRLIPVKSNAAYELYQTQCLQDEGLFQARTGRLHPSYPGSRERQEYKDLGEVAYLDRKRQQFWESVWADPADFLDRVAQRFFGATVWYVPHDRDEEARRPWALWARRLTHPLPFLALVVLLWTAFREPLCQPQVIVIGVYALYLSPYIAASYYERYVVPLVAVKVLLVLWAADRLLSLRQQIRRSH
jgi:hypothetical protein